MTAMATVFPPSHLLDFNVWPHQPTSEWLINHNDLPNITDLDDLVFASEPSHTENPMSYIDTLELTPSSNLPIPDIDNFIVSKFIQESIQSGLPSVVANAESGEPRLDAPPQSHSGTFTFSRPSQRTSAMDHSLQVAGLEQRDINDTYKHKDSLSNRASSLLAATPKGKNTMEVDVKEEAFSPKAEIEQDQQMEKSPG